MLFMGAFRNDKTLTKVVLPEGVYGALPSLSANPPWPEGVYGARLLAEGWG
jgi:hypothetical protein